ncbi:MAG: phosphoenolpyruvate--protein phosphotransferase [Desulfobacterales bacterium]
MERKSREHLDLVCDISELAALISGSGNIQSFLSQTVEMVKRHMHTDVCSIYLLDEENEELVLEATVGLNPAAVGRVRMKVGEGLVGAIFESREPMNEGVASRNPRFKYFEEAEEDRYNSLLGVPIIRGVEKIGVLVVQHEKRDYFDNRDVIAMRAIASQLAGAIGNARFLMELDRRQRRRPRAKSSKARLQFIKGVTVSGGLAFGPSMRLDKNHVALVEEDNESDPEYTLNDFQKAMLATVEQIKEMQSRFSERLPESASLIFTAHIMMLKDVRFVEEIKTRIRQKIPAAKAIRSVAEHYAALFSSSSHPLLREKAHDVEDLAQRLLANLRQPNREATYFSKNRVVIANKLYPSDVLKIATEDVKGIILVSGGATSHVAILTRSLQIPMIIAERPELLQIPDGTPVLMDAEIGNIYVEPSERIAKQFESQKDVHEVVATLAATMQAATKTRDGSRIQLLANINLLRDLILARELKAEGVGLYRTEFPFLVRSDIPSEEEQYNVYRRLFDDMSGQPVTIRTLDLGGDKLLAYSEASRESNPDLGLRAIRFSLRHRDLFQQQLSAILRAAADFKDLRIMFPMITSLDEFRAARMAVDECLAGLKRNNFPHHKNPLIGVMIEVPSLLEIVKEIAEEADFMSIGTNDFVQYMLAVDRSNDKVADYYQPWHPAVLRGLARIVSAAEKTGKELSVCGELAHETDYIPFLLGVGVRKFSVYPRFLPTVQQIAAGINVAEARQYAAALLAQTTIRGVRDAVKEMGDKFVPAGPRQPGSRQP